jgi:predicted dehydrogenase
MVVFNDVEPLEKIRIFDKRVETLPYTDTFAEFQISYRHGDVTIPHIPFEEPLKLECEHFVECLRNGSEPRSSGHVGHRVVRILEAADRSIMNNGQSVPILNGKKVHS